MDPDRVDPAEGMMREVGAQLRRARLERDEELEQVAEYLRIRAPYLAAIEAGDLSVMPGRTYALGFLRSYADHLGFDGEDLIDKIKSTVEGLTDRTRLRIRTPMPESRLPRTPIVVLSLALIAGVYTGWSYLGRSSQRVVETVAEVPANLRDLALDALPEDDRPAPPVAPRDTPPATGATPPAGEAEAMPPEAEPADAAPTGNRESPTTAATATPEATPTTPRLAAPAVTPDAGPVGVPASDTQAPTTPDVTAADATSTSTPEVTAAEPASGLPTAEERRRAASAFDLEIRGVTSPATAAPSDASAAPTSGAIDGSDAAPSPAETVVARLLDPAADGPAAPARVHETANRDARVVLRARSETWIQVSSTSGDYLRSLTLEPDEAFLVPNRPDLHLWTGNAGGLEVVVDGEPVSPLGASGEVIRDVSLDPEQLRRSGPLPAGD